mgnify:CR=1 FL=1
MNGIISAEFNLGISISSLTIFQSHASSTDDFLLGLIYAMVKFHSETKIKCSGSECAYYLAITSLGPKSTTKTNKYPNAMTMSMVPNV